MGGCVKVEAHQQRGRKPKTGNRTERKKRDWKMQCSKTVRKKGKVTSLRGDTGQGVLRVQG